MQSTFDALSPEKDATAVDPSVTPDIGDNMDLAAIVQRLDDLAAEVKSLSEMVKKPADNSPQENNETPADEPQGENESEE